MTVIALPARRTSWRRPSVIPGFGITFGFTLTYLSLIVLIPLSAAFIRTAGMSGADFARAVFSPSVLASYRLSFGVSLLAAFVNAIFGCIVAWVLVRYSFPGRRLVDAFVDLPFALPTAVAGIALTALYAKNGWVGHWLDLKYHWTPWGVLIGASLGLASGMYMLIRDALRMNKD